MTPVERTPTDEDLTALRRRVAELEHLCAEQTAERVRLEEQLRQAQKFEALGRFAGGIAHDFNNLLTAILGYVSLLQRVPLAAEHRQYLATCEKAAQRAAELTRQILSQSRGLPR